MTPETTAFFVVPDRVNFRALTEFTDKILKYLYYYMGRSGSGLGVGHNIEICICGNEPERVLLCKMPVLQGKPAYAWFSGLMF